MFFHRCSYDNLALITLHVLLMHYIANHKIWKMGDRFFTLLSAKITENTLTESAKSESQNPKFKFKL